MTLPDLPPLDYTTEEALQTSAETRASVALQMADGPLYFKGLELRLTPSIKSLFFMLQRLDGVDESAGDRHERDAILLLYLASQPKEKWSAPVQEGGRFLQPLRSRPGAWLAAIDEWADATIGNADLADAVAIVDKLWEINHAPRVVLDSPESGSGMAEKKTQLPPGNSES